MRFWLALSAIIYLSACMPETDPAASRQADATRTMTNEADRQVGMPRIANFQERRFAREVLEARDSTVTTYAYIQSLDGRMHCLGQAIGYGIPYGVQFTAPQYPQWIHLMGGGSGSGDAYMMEQPEPNGLYMPDNAEATWIRLIDPRTGRAAPVYVEPRVTVTPFQLPASIVATPCPTAAHQ